MNYITVAICPFPGEPKHWQDWHNDFHTNDEDDIPVEWGNYKQGHYDDFYQRMLDYSKGKGWGRNISEQKTKTNQVFFEIDEFFTFTYCQSRYYDNFHLPGNYPSGASCSDPSRIAP